MPQEYWQNYPRMDYWPDYPDRWLLSTKANAMPNRVYGAYHRILCHLRREKLPGIMALNHEQIMDWGKMKGSEWKTDASLLLAAFRAYTDGTLHHEFIKDLYRESCQRLYGFYVSGIKSRSKKAAKTKKSEPNDQYVLPYLDPYSKWEQLGWCVANETRVFDAETGCLRVPEGALGCLRVPIVDYGKRVSEIVSKNYLTQAAHDSPDGEEVVAASESERRGEVGPLNFHELKNLLPPKNPPKGAAS